MEQTRSLPSGGVAADRLADLVRPTGPVLTVSVELDPHQPDADHRAELAWRSLREEAERLGAPGPLLDRVGEEVVEAGRTEEQLVVVADESGVRFAQPASGDANVATGVRWQAVPWFAPVVATLQDAIDYAVVVVDRAGGDITVHRAGHEETREVGTESFPLHKTPDGGWSHRRLQRRVEQSWRVNAADVAAAVSELVRDEGIEVVALGGDEKATALVEEQLPSDVAAKVTAIEAARGAGSDDEGEAEAVEVLLADVAARRTVDLLRAVRELEERGGAVKGEAEVLAALQQAQVALLLFADTPDTEVPYDPERPELIGLEEAGAAKCPLSDAAVAAAVATGARVRLTPAHAGHGALQALLRWDRGDQGEPATTEV